MLHDRQAFDKTLRRLPNALTWSRALLVIPFLGASFAPVPWGPEAAFWIFIAAALTDFMDGWLARRLRTTSAFGAWLDPVADKALVGAALLVLVLKGPLTGLHLLPAFAIFVREALMLGARGAPSSAARFPVIRLARWKTAAQMSALALLLYSAAGAGAPFAEPLGLGAFWVAAGLSLLTGWAYLGTGKAPNGADEPPEGDGNHEAVVLRLDQARDRHRRRGH